MGRVPHSLGVAAVAGFLVAGGAACGSSRPKAEDMVNDFISKRADRLHITPRPVTDCIQITRATLHSNGGDYGLWATGAQFQCDGARYYVIANGQAFSVTPR